MASDPGGYNVRRLQVTRDNTWLFILTAPATTSSDTYLEVYDHRFQLIATNDDFGNDLYARLEVQLAKGDYYFVVRGYAMWGFDCILEVSQY